MAKKMTKKELFAEILANYDLKDYHRELIEKTIDQLDRKSASSGDRKPTAKQLDNDKFKDCILDFLKEHSEEQFTITELWKKVPALAENSEMSNQRVSSLVRQLVLDNFVVREEIKRKAYFKAV